MSWQGIEGHDDVVEQFRRALARGRLASTFLFVGPAGIGKRAFALKLAQALLCQVNPQERLEPCGRCASCLQVQALTHPDLLLVEKPADKSTIPLELLIGPSERRMQEGLCHNIGLKPFMGGRRVAIINDADLLAEEGANALLKTLEEPPPRSVLILISASQDKQLPTIRSRSEIVRFRPLDDEVVARLLVARGDVENADEAARIARYSGGSLARASELADADLWAFRNQLLDALVEPNKDRVGFAGALIAFVDAAGKEAPPRRARARQTIGFAADFYRQVMRGLCGAQGSDDPELARAAQRGISNWRGSEESAGDCLARCLEALEQIDRNANQAMLLEGWFDAVAEMSARP